MGATAAAMLVETTTAKGAAKLAMAKALAARGTVRSATEAAETAGC